MKKIIVTAFLLLVIGIFPAYAQNPVDMNTGSFVQDGEWIYYWNCYDRNIYKVKTDGTENVLIFDDFYTVDGKVGFCFDDNYIYFITKGFKTNMLSGIFRVDKISGEYELIKSTINSNEIKYLYNNRLVYASSEGIYSVKTDGTDGIRLSDAYSHCVVGENGYIYYSNLNDNGIYKSRVDKQGEEKVSDDRTFYMQIENGYLYFDNRLDDGKLYKMKADGTEKEKINDDDCYYMIMKNGWVYYTSGQEGYALCRQNGDTLEKQYLAECGYYNINVTDNIVFFSGYGENSSSDDIFTLNMGTGDIKGLLLDKSLFGNGSDLQILIRGKKLSVEDGDVPPLIIDGRSLVPVRAFANMLDIDVDWNEETQTAIFTKTDMNGDKRYYNSVIIKPCDDILIIEKSAAPSEKYIPKIIERSEVKLDVPAALINGRIMVPVRAIADAFGFDVDWYEDSLTAHIFGDGASWYWDYIEEFDAIDDWERKVQIEERILTFRDKDDNILLDSGDIEYAKAVYGDISMSKEEWYIEFKFTPSGVEKFKAATTQVSTYPEGQNYLSIFLGEDLISSPRVMLPIDSDTAVITRSFTEEEAKSLADSIMAGL